MSEIETAIFVGDVHLDERIPERESAFCQFLEHVRQVRPDVFFLMGDIFEFWFGYKTVMFASYINVISRIAAIAHSGIKITYLVGNHDFLPGPVFEKYLGVEVLLHPIVMKFGDHQVYLSHGDEINKRDYGYRILKYLIRNPTAQLLFRGIPASWAWHIGKLTSDTSRKLTNLKACVPWETYAQFLENLGKNGIDTVIHGHTHRPDSRIVDTVSGSGTSYQFRSLVRTMSLC